LVINHALTILHLPSPLYSLFTLTIAPMGDLGKSVVNG